MIRFVFILSVFVLVIQAKPSENEYYRLLENLLEERDVQTCGINDKYLNCNYQQQCQGETCPGDKYCCSSKCGNICLCHPIPQNCSKHCVYGYQLGNNGCYICECNTSKRSFKQFLTRLLQKDEEKEEIEDEERKELSSVEK
ncbi:uncharacterized protein [Mytilus edulis]|uniref:uncharacterized protein n=1 Tax=Mytilus edulis TaxID=6550 RepID=UPI0039F077C4